MSQSWAKLATSFYAGAKVQSLTAREAHVYLLVILINAREQRDGQLSPQESQAKYLAGQLPPGWKYTASSLSKNLSNLETAGLLERDKGDGSLRIVGWNDIWRPPLSDAERARRARERKRKKAGVSRPQRDGESREVTSRKEGRNEGTKFLRDEIPSRDGGSAPADQRTPSASASPQTVQEALMDWRVFPPRFVPEMAERIEAIGWPLAAMCSARESLERIHGRRWRRELRGQIEDLVRLEPRAPATKVDASNVAALLEGIELEDGPEPV